MSGSFRRAAACIAALVLSLGLVACTHDDPDRRYGSVSPLPSQSATPTPSPTPTGTQGMSDKEQVKALYTDFIRQYPEAQGVPEPQRRTFLSRWLTEPVLGRYTHAIQAQNRKHQRFEGTLRPRIFGTKVTGSRAVIDDCLDASHALVRDSKTRKVVARNPKAGVWNVVRLKRTGAGWRIYDTRPRNDSCAGR